jgi:hypothetical protein
MKRPRVLTVQIAREPAEASGGRPHMTTPIFVMVCTFPWLNIEAHWRKELPTNHHSAGDAFID